MRLNELSPTFEGIGILSISILVLWYTLTSISPASDAFTIALGMSAIGILAAAGDILDYYDMDDYIDFSNLDSANDSSRKKKENIKKKTPPVPAALKNKLYYERANGACEHCGERVDQPHVHHIKPRADGGPNTMSNLIVLCPNCHSKADSGLIARHRLRYRARQQNNQMEEKAK